MNTMNSPDPLQKSIDGALARLPEWHPSQDFSTRLAGAAARQMEQHTLPSEPAISIWLEQITRLTPVILGSAGLAVTAGWLVPWSQISIDATVWTCVLAMASTGAVLTVRVLRGY
jgi:hypothetical protein